jgi:hypothetical protein
LPWRPPAGYPQRLLCNGRAPEPDFSPTEKLFFRIPPLQQDEESFDFLEPAKIPPVPFSVNRERFSEPADVVFLHSPDWGIGFFRVQDIPPVIESESGIKFEFRVEHLPLDDETGNNYAHAEVKVYRDGVEVTNKQLGSHVKAVFRELLSKRGKLFKRPVKPANGDAMLI